MSNERFVVRNKANITMAMKANYLPTYLFIKVAWSIYILYFTNGFRGIKNHQKFKADTS